MCLQPAGCQELTSAGPHDPHVRQPGDLGDRLAAVLLLRVPDEERVTELGRLAVFPDATIEQNQEILA